MPASSSRWRWEPDGGDDPQLQFLHAAVRRGEEKGRFEFGGSTIVVLTEPGKVVPDADLTANTKDGWETVVKMGERVGSVSPV